MDRDFHSLPIAWKNKNKKKKSNIKVLDYTLLNAAYTCN